MKVPCRSQHRRAGVALVLILAFLVLLTVAVVAFFSRAIVARQVSSSSAAQTGADTLARSAANSIIADLKQEIVAGSTAYTPMPGVTIYTPTSDPSGMATPPVLTSSVVPWVSGAPTPATALGPPPIPNLLRRSVRSSGDSTYIPFPTPGAQPAPYYTNPPTNLASAVNSVADRSANGRAVSMTQWNAHYLVPLANPSASPTSSTPVSNFVAPDWVFVTTNGPKVLTTPDTTTIGRFAYAIYDEGGLLDANVAGCPSTVTNTSTLADAKGFAAFADLTALGLTTQQSDNLVGWRNYATTQPAGSLAMGNYSFTNTSATNYFNFILGQSTGFLSTNTSNYTAGSAAGTFSSTPMTFGTPVQMDQSFTNRQSLIKFWAAAGFPASSLQYFGTFTRDLNRPNFVPLANPLPPAGLSPAAIITYPFPSTASPNPPQAPLASTGYEPNPIVQNVITPATAAIKGIPVITQRFPLSRIALLANPTANAMAIKHYFGLTYYSAPQGSASTGEYQWLYSHTGSTAPGATSSILSLAQVAGLTALRESGTDPTTGLPYRQEPDFFEYLQAAILYGSLGNYNQAATTATIPVNGDGGFNAATSPSQFCTNIIQIGANLIDQYDADNLPTVISFNNQTYAGVENLPYFSELLLWPYRPKKTNPATYSGVSVGDPDQFNLAGFLMIELWNPHQNAVNISTGSSPTQMRFMIKASLPLPITVDPTNPLTKAADTTVVMPTIFAGGETLQVTYNNDTAFTEPTTLGPAGGPASPDGNWFQMTDGAPARQGLLMGVQTLPDYDLAAADGLPNAGYQQYKSFFSWYGGGSSEPVFYLQYTADGVNWFNYQGTATNSSSIAISYLANENEGQYGTELNKPSPFGPQVTNDISWSNYANIGAESSQVADPRSKSEQSLFVGQSTLNLSVRPGTPAGSAGNLSGADVDRYIISNPQSYAYPLYGGGSTFKDYAGVLTNAYTGMYNENADNNHSGYNLNNSFMTANPSALNTYLVDADGVMRPGDGFYGGNPLPSGNTLFRPLILNRPFRSVGEMGYAQRAWGPWKSINFFSQQSADAGLLDYFSIDSAPVTAGKVNLNTRQPLVLQAILQGAYRIEPFNGAAVDTLTPGDAANIAGAIVAHTEAIAPPATPSVPPYIPGPLVSRADLVRSLLGDPAIVGKLNSIHGTAGTDPSNTTKIRREALIRSLADVGTTRTWNLLIDIVAQAGIYPPNVSGLKNFVVTGEKHYWLHVALDRYTGTVTDEQMELVNE